MNSRKATNWATEIACKRWPQKPSAVIDILCEKVTSDVRQRLLVERLCRQVGRGAAVVRRKHPALQPALLDARAQLGHPLLRHVVDLQPELVLRWEQRLQRVS